MRDELGYIFKTQNEISHLLGIVRLLEWDQSTNMPAAGLKGKSEQIRIIKGMVHKKLISKRLSYSIRLAKRGRLTKKQAIVIAELERQVRKRKRVPVKLITELAQRTVIGQAAWSQARKNNDFSIFLPELKKIIDIKRRQARLLDPDVKPYDALLQEYEEGMTSQRMQEILEYLKKELLLLLGQIKKTSRYKRLRPLKLHMDVDDQKEIVNRIIMDMGISNERVAIGVSLHPFSTRITGDDVRITTRYRDPLESFFSAVHEAGHALYDLGLPKEYQDTVVYKGASYSMHECQSIFWENMIARSLVFWKAYFPNYKRFLKKGTSWRSLYEHVNMVEPSYVRVSADEVTYCLHIILRFEIEMALINGRLKVQDAKETWNSKMKEYLGLRPKDDNHGILQDIHWACGDFGYFPTYAVGIIYAAQIYGQLLKDHPKTPKHIAELDLHPIVSWLRKNIHDKGKTMQAEDIIRDVCGVGLEPKVFIRYLRQKYSDIYGFRDEAESENDQASVGSQAKMTP